MNDDNITEINTSNFADCYSLERKLMSGSYGTVYVGVDLKKRQRFAVKVVDRRCVRNVVEMLACLLLILLLLL
jgi:hypothetical protein